MAQLLKSFYGDAVDFLTEINWCSIWGKWIRQYQVLPHIYVNSQTAEDQSSQLLYKCDSQFPPKCDWDSFGHDCAYFEYPLGWFCYAHLATLLDEDTVVSVELLYS